MYNTLERAWHIFMLIMRIQWRLVDFIILKKHPVALKYFTRYNKSPTLGKERRRYWQKTFWSILKEFIALYPSLPSNWKLLLEDLNNKRDHIAHWYISLGREYILYQPDLWRRDISIKLKWIRGSVDWKITKMSVFRLRFDDENYENMVKAVLKFDEKLFPSLAIQLGIDYKTIR